MSLLHTWFQKLRKASGKYGYTCDCCGEELFDYPAHRLCFSCEAGLERNEKYRCNKCGRKSFTEGVCLTCKGKPPLFDKGISPFVYRAETASLVNRLKNGDRRLAFYFGEQATATFLQENPVISADETLVVIPVPLTKEKQGERGYNQAQELAEVVCDALNARKISARLETDALQKLHETAQQKHLTSAERTKNASGAYHLHKRKLFEGKTVLLVDDILTTGATGSACARLMKGAGAKRVILLTVASLPERK
ncbi:MAG: ComF family protein [Clostridiales bacterium]|nr:ComF family protein [Clostridiales bacterium]